MQTEQNATGAVPAPDSHVENVINRIAEMAHWANRSWCHMNGDDTQPKWEDAPAWQKDSAGDGVRFTLANPNATPEDSHENWYRTKAADGWKYGATKDPEKKEHPCMVAYKELPFEQQLKDSIYQGIVRNMLTKHIEAGQLVVDRPLTDGEDVMNIQFNPGGNPAVNRIKRAFADLHDLCVKESTVHREAILAKEKSDPNFGMPLAYNKKANQAGRLMAVALTNIEQAQMWAVKSVTR